MAIGRTKHLDLKDLHLVRRPCEIDGAPKKPARATRSALLTGTAGDTAVTVYWRRQMELPKTTTANPLRAQRGGDDDPSNVAVHVNMDGPSPAQGPPACGFAPKCPMPKLVTSQGKATPLFGDGLPPPHILTYDPHRMWNTLAPFVARDVTVCMNMRVWAKDIGFVGLALLIMLVLPNIGAFPDGEFGGGNACDASVNGPNSEVCQLNDVLQSSKTEFRFLARYS
mmetsp:Transcript_26461/g.70777  ORF Transcript_26461/g.70777 Transcript_26461/m.70777 type:complete len:225 (-) Transcript_26461:13-687(-)